MMHQLSFVRAAAFWDEPERYSNFQPANQSPSSMEDERSAKQQRVLKTGKIVLANGNSTIECVIRDISSSGAHLKVPTVVGIPDQFDFVELPLGKRRKVAVAWRTPKALGVRFLDSQ
jgi:hypothetical protein